MALVEQREPKMQTASETKLKVQARALQSGDITGSGEMVIGVMVGLTTPRGKVEVVLERGTKTRRAIWGASTLINVTRAV